MPYYLVRKVSFCFVNDPLGHQCPCTFFIGGIFIEATIFGPVMAPHLEALILSKVETATFYDTVFSHNGVQLLNLMDGGRR